MMVSLSKPIRSSMAFTLFLAVVGALPTSAWAQGSGTVRGTVTSAATGQPIRSANVSVQGTGIATVTDRAGAYVLSGVPAGPQTILVRRLGFRVAEASVTVSAGGTHTVDVAFEAVPIPLGEIIVSAASRGPERVVEAPSAISVVDLGVARDMSITGQPARALARLPGVDVAQSGMLDYNVNARGLNSSLSRRVLVLQDGRDLAFTFLGAPSWGFMTNSLEDMESIEMVRGPGSALYGANAYNGVVAFTTPNARDQIGTRFTLAGGELSTIRGDFRHGGVTPDGKIGYRVGGGYYASDSWTVSRTTGDSSDLRREYAPASDIPAPKLIDAVPLFGQTLDGTTRAGVGDPDKVVGMHGAARVDYYLRGGSVGTVEGGAARLENEAYVTGIGRVQIADITRPWARAAWAAPRFNLMAWYSGEKTGDPAQSLGAGIPIEIDANSVHAEGQVNTPFGDGRGRIVVGASARTSSVDTKATLIAAEFDDRSDQYYSVFGQIEWDLIPELKIVGAARLDEGNLYDAQFSPKAALVFSPSADHGIRATFNRAFQTASSTEFFVRVPGGRPADFTLLEAGLRASALGPVLAGVPNGELFTNSSAVPVLAFGNENLEVETVTSFEVGYKGQVANQSFVYVDVHFSRYKNFVTDLLPAVNSKFPAWTAPAAVPSAFAAAVEDAVRTTLAGLGQTLAAAGMTRLPGTDATAIVVSYTNAGTVDEVGLEIGGAVAVTPEFQLDGNYSFFDFDVKPDPALPGDQLRANSPQHRVKLSGAYRGEQGFDARVSAEIVGSYDWGAGVFNGEIPSRQFVDVSAGYRANNTVRVHLTATNVLDQKRFMMYGGSVIGRRLLGGVTAIF